MLLASSAFIRVHPRPRSFLSDARHCAGVLTMASLRKLLFVDRDGTLIVEPPDQQIDSYAKLALVEGVIPALRRCVAAGYELVMVTNQDGLGTSSFPQADFDGPQNLLLQILGSQGVAFRDILIDRSFAHENRDSRKPGVGLARGYLAADDWSRAASAVIGDRETDLQFAANLGVRGFRLGSEWDWDTIAHALCDAPRTAAVERGTNETRIRVSVDLDRAADATVATGIGFFDHMLEQVGKHGGFALTLTCAGDGHVDEHHIVEDCALALGEALRKALGDKRGIGRYGWYDLSRDAGHDPSLVRGTGLDVPVEPLAGASRASTQLASNPGSPLSPQPSLIDILLPMDETLARAALDLSGRPYCVFDGRFPRERVGELPTELVPHFFRSLCEALGANLHLAVRGENAHHMVEACFKATARALRQALRREGDALPSTKGVL
jgi:imidazoleglycerol-phosphate dehydratase / histidinol-phosphatase